MKKIFLTLTVFTVLLTAGSELVCQKVKKEEVATVIGHPMNYARVGKHPFPNAVYCEYGDGVLPEVSIYYFSDPDSYGSAAMYEKTKPISGLNPPAKAVFVPSSGDVVQLLGQTPDGAISIVFLNGIKEGGEAYRRAVKLLEDMKKRFE
jgi:hypothetical protein